MFWNVCDIRKEKRTDSVVTVITKRKERTNWNAAPVAHIDKNGFGRKMLEKFGWSPGEGLGAEKQGIKEHLKAKMKTDNAGIGFKSSGEEWLKQQNDFSELLANLSGNNTEVEEEEVSISTGRNSLELKSKQSRARVHCCEFTDKKNCNNGSAEDLLIIPDSSDSGILSENSEVTMKQNNCGIVKTENTKKESKLTSENDSYTDGIQYCVKKKKKKKRTSEKSYDDIQYNGDTIDGNLCSENKKLNQLDFWKDNNEDNVVVGNDMGLSGEECPVKFVKTANPFLLQEEKKMLEKPKGEKDKNKNEWRQNQSNRNGVNENHTIFQSSGNANNLTHTQRLKSRIHKTPVFERKKQIGVVINNSRYQVCIAGESPKINNIDELYYKYVMGIVKDSGVSNVIDNNNTTDVEDTSTGEMRSQRGYRMQGKRERILALSRKSKVIRKPTIDHRQSYMDYWNLHTVHGVHQYLKSLDKINILRAVVNFKGASLVNVEGYPTQIGHISVASNENEVEPKSEETCTSEKQSKIKTLFGEQQNNYVGPTSSNTSDGQIIVNNKLNRQPAVWS